MTGVHPLTNAATASTSPTMTTFVFIAAPPDHIANDFLTIKRNGFTKVTKRKPGGCSQNREVRLGGHPSRFRHKPISETCRLSPNFVARSFAESYRPRQKCDSCANVPETLLTLTEVTDDRMAGAPRPGRSGEDGGSDGAGLARRRARSVLADDPRAQSFIRDRVARGGPGRCAQPFHCRRAPRDAGAGGQAAEPGPGRPPDQPVRRRAHAPALHHCRQDHRQSDGAPPKR